MEKKINFMRTSRRTKQNRVHRLQRNFLLVDGILNAQHVAHEV